MFCHLEFPDMLELARKSAKWGTSLVTALNEEFTGREVRIPTYLFANRWCNEAGGQSSKNASIPMKYIRDYQERLEEIISNNFEGDINDSKITQSITQYTKNINKIDDLIKEEAKKK